jgi:hypothetical protein
MRWNLRMKAAEHGIWKSTEMRRRLAEAGLEISAARCPRCGPAPREGYASVRRVAHGAQIAGPGTNVLRPRRDAVLAGGQPGGRAGRARRSRADDGRFVQIEGVAL